MSARRTALAALPVLAALAGCAAPPAELFSTMTLEPGLLAGDIPDETSVTRDVEVRKVTHLIFWVPTDTQPPTLAEVVGEALDRGNGDVLVNASVERVAWYVPFVYGEYGWVVRGDVMRLHYRRSHRFEVEPEAGGDSELPAPEPHERPGSTPPAPRQEAP